MVTDRSQGGGSVKDGEMELMVSLMIESLSYPHGSLIITITLKIKLKLIL